MTRLIIDTSGYLVSTIVSHPLHAGVRDILAHADVPPVVSPLVLAEINYIVLNKAGFDAEITVIDDLTSSAYDLAALDLDDLRVARRVVARHRDLKVGLTDAVNVVIAERFDTNEILTTDQRHFRRLMPLSTRFAAFRLLPFDS